MHVATGPLTAKTLPLLILSILVEGAGCNVDSDDPSADGRSPRQGPPPGSTSSATEAHAPTPAAVASLAAFKTTDPILKEAVTQVMAVLPSLMASHLPGPVDFLVLDYPEDWESQVERKYHTDGCKALVHAAGRPTVLCNAKLLYETEAAIRVGVSRPQDFATDEGLFSLVRGVQRDLRAFLMRTRSQPPEGLTTATMDAQVITQLKLMLLFFFGHEIWHIRDAKSGAFMSALAPDAPLEHRVHEAVVKMCRHADEFNKLGFDLPGFTDVVNIESKIRSHELKSREKLEYAFESTRQWYQDEIAADDFANALMVKYLSSLDKSGEIRGQEEQHLLIGSLYFSAIYHWYKDFHTFSFKAVGEPMTNSRQFMVCMMKDRGQYVKAAALFGSVHRCLLLRCHLAIDYILRKRTDFFSLEPKKRTIWCTREDLAQLGQEKRTLKIWRHANLQQHHLLAILMDTPVKLAHMGAAVGWLNEVEQRQGSVPMFVMTFETMSQALKRLTRLP